MVQLMEAAHRRGLERIEGDILADNRELLSLAESLSFEILTSDEDPTLGHVSKRL